MVISADKVLYLKGVSNRLVKCIKVVVINEEKIKNSRPTAIYT